MAAMQEGPGDLWSRFAIAVFRVNSSLIEAGERITGPLGQTSARWQVIGRVAFEAKTVAQLAREIGHARQSVQRVADRLELDGLVQYLPYPGDARTKQVALTPLGHDVLGRIYAAQLAWSERVLEQLDHEQLEAAVRTLDQVAEALDADRPPTDHPERRTG